MFHTMFHPTPRKSTKRLRYKPLLSKCDVSKRSSEARYSKLCLWYVCLSQSHLNQTVIDPILGHQTWKRLSKRTHLFCFGKLFDTFVSSSHKPGWTKQSLIRFCSITCENGWTNQFICFALGNCLKHTAETKRTSRIAKTPRRFVKTV